MSKLTDKQKEFCRLVAFPNNMSPAECYAQAYGHDLNQKTHKAAAHKALQKDHIQAEVVRWEEINRKRTEEKNGVDLDRVVGRLVEMDEMDILDCLDEAGKPKPFREWPRIWRRLISPGAARKLGLLERVEDGDQEEILWAALCSVTPPDLLKTIETIGKLTTVGAFTEKSIVEMKGEVTKVVREIVD